MIYVHVLGLPVEISEDQNVYNQLPKVWEERQVQNFCDHTYKAEDWNDVITGSYPNVLWYFILTIIAEKEATKMI